MKILDFGCGRKKYPGSIGIDMAPNSAADIKCNVDKFPYPMKDNTFDFIWSHHSLEHVTDIFKTLEEIYRIAKPNAIIEVHVPHAIQAGAMAHLDHKRTFKTDTFDIFDPEYSDKAHSNELYSHIRFKVLSRRLSYRNCGYSRTDEFKGRRLSNWIIRALDVLSNKHQYSYERMWGYWVGGSEEIIFRLQVLK